MNTCLPLEDHKALLLDEQGMVCSTTLSVGSSKCRGEIKDLLAPVEKFFDASVSLPEETEIQKAASKEGKTCNFLIATSLKLSCASSLMKGSLMRNSESRTN